MPDETTSLLNGDVPSDPHSQFCLLIGLAPDQKPPARRNRHDSTLYTRATKKRKAQSMTYNFTAAASNTLLLSQVVLGATLTALGASGASHVLITIFGVMNTIIAGLVAYLKSRGQPMRARMFRDDLEHVVEEIENSKTMWLGIQNGIHGYDEIDIEDKVSVRSEVARLTRLYESAVKKYIENNPELYNTKGGMLGAIKGLRARPPPGAQLPPHATGTGAAAAPAATPMAAFAPLGGADESPATAKKAALRSDDDHSDHESAKSFSQPDERSHAGSATTPEQPEHADAEVVFTAGSSKDSSGDGVNGKPKS